MTSCSTGSWTSPSIARDDFRAGDLELVPLAAHRLDQNREVQFTPAGDREDIGLLGRLNPQGEVGLQFAVQPLAELAGGASTAPPGRRTARC